MSLPVMLTFDLDGESLALAADPANARRPGVLSQGAYGPRVGVFRILECLARHSVPATFFVPGMIVERYPDAVAAIAAAGHEVAHHGYTHLSPADMDPAEELAEMRRATGLIVAATGRRPAGYRSPSWDFSPHTLGFLRDEGFVYSSNLMDDDRAYVHPGGLVELPVQWLLDDAPFFLFRPPYSRPISPPEAALATWLAELDALAAEEGRCFVLTMHPQLSGRASRVALLDRLVTYAKGIAGTGFMRCADYAREVKAGYRPAPQSLARTTMR
ncbi:MAG: polysaccharide deacetylase [Bacillota bacterium]|nr:polysaccharide deacetylase [Bacillota bacterium]